MHKVILPIILSAVLGLSLLAIQTNQVSAAVTDKAVSVSVCCAWNEKIAGGVLTYKVSGGSEEIQIGIIAAIEEWDAKMGDDLDFEINTMKGKAGKADITVKFKKGGGMIAGMAVRNFDKGTDFVKSVQINISGKAFGKDNLAPIIQQITKHEFGHALGLGHANFDGDVMSTTVGAGASTISPCDVDGVIAANHWALGHIPVGDKHTPHVNHVHC